MIFGLNFNGTQIPEGIKRKFRQRVRVAPRVLADLKGVGQSVEELDIMLTVANNGHRHLHVEERKTPVGVWYGIYVY